MKIKTKFTLLVAVCTLLLLGVNYAISVYSANKAIIEFNQRSAVILSSAILEQEQVADFIAALPAPQTINTTSKALFAAYPEQAIVVVSDKQVVLDNVSTLGANLTMREVDSGFQFEVGRDGTFPSIVQIGGEQHSLVFENKNYLLFWFPKAVLSRNIQQNALSEDLNYSFLSSLVILSAIAIVLSWLGAGYFLRPLQTVSKGFATIKSGDLNARLAVERHDEVGELINGFNQLASWLQGLHQQYEQMNSDLSHELRTPLNALKSRLEAIEDGLLQPNVEQIQQMQEELAVVLRIVEDLNLLSLADEQVIKLHIEKVDVGLLATNLVEQYRERSTGTNVILSSEIEQGSFAQLDKARLRQVLVNLLDNAFKYGAGGGCISLKVKRVEGVVNIIVADNGVGLTMQQQELVFERFFRVQTSRTSFNNLGLGLPICKHLVELMGGEISLGSAPQQGCEFKVSFSEAS